MFGVNTDVWRILLAPAFSHERMLSSSSSAALSAAEDEAEKEVLSLTLLSSCSDLAGQVLTCEWSSLPRPPGRSAILFPQKRLSRSKNGSWLPGAASCARPSRWRRPSAR
jgi:hypothetical protein